MRNTLIHASDLRQLLSLTTALLEDASLMAELSVIEKEHIQGACLALRSLLPVVEARDMEDAMNES